MHIYIHVPRWTSNIFLFLFYAPFLKGLFLQLKKKDQLQSSQHTQKSEIAQPALFEQSFLSPAEFMLTLQFAQFAFWKLPSSSF